MRLAPKFAGTILVCGGFKGWGLFDKKVDEVVDEHRETFNALAKELGSFLLVCVW